MIPFRPAIHACLRLACATAFLFPLAASARDFCTSLAKSAPGVFAMGLYAPPQARGGMCEVRSADGLMTLQVVHFEHPSPGEFVRAEREKAGPDVTLGEEPTLGTAVRKSSREGRIVTIVFAAGENLFSVTMTRVGKALGDAELGRLRFFAKSLLDGERLPPDYCALLARHAAEVFGRPGARLVPRRGACSINRDDGFAMMDFYSVPTESARKDVDEKRVTKDPTDKVSVETGLGDGALIRKASGKQVDLYFACANRMCALTYVSYVGKVSDGDLTRVRAFAKVLQGAQGAPVAP